MKILALGDLHNDYRLVKKLAELAKKEKIDLIILTGDLTNADDPIDNLLKPFSDAGLKILLIPGNHETNATANFLAEAYENTFNIHGTHHIHKNLGFFGMGGADIPVNQVSEKELERNLKKAHEELLKKGGFDKKILVTHWHPAGTKSEFSGFSGSKSIRKAIENFKPHLAIFSHIHEAAGMEEKIGDSRVMNVSRKGFIIDI